MKLILGSKSPRRQQLLTEMGCEFEVQVIDTDESYPSHLTPQEVAVHIATQKAMAFQGQLASDEQVLTADTIVCVDGHILGKPKDDEEARKMLQLLSGKQHEVITAVVLADNTSIKNNAASTKVNVKELTIEEINFYIETYQPFDKAGSYGIQEWFGAIGITSIEGSYNNVVGLPTHLVYELLNK